MRARAGAAAAVGSPHRCPRPAAAGAHPASPALPTKPLSAPGPHPCSHCAPEPCPPPSPLPPAAPSFPPLQLARENNINFTSVIRNGQMLGVADRRNRNTVSMGSAAGIPGASMALLGEAQLTNFYNDGNKGTGTASEMALEERQLLAVEGIVIAAVDVLRDAAMVRAVAEAAARHHARHVGGGRRPA